MDLKLFSGFLPVPQADLQYSDFSLGFGVSRDSLMTDQAPEMLLAKDWGSEEAKFCNRTAENIVVFKDTYGNGQRIDGTVVPPNECAKGDAAAFDRKNGDDRISQADWLWKGPNRISVDVVPSDNAFGVAILPQDAWSAATIAAAAAKNGADHYGFMDFPTFRNVMSSDKPVLVNGRDFSVESNGVSAIPKRKSP